MLARSYIWIARLQAFQNPIYLGTETRKGYEKVRFREILLLKLIKWLSDIPMSRTIFLFWIGEYGHSQFIKTTKDDTVISSLQIVPMKHKDDPVRYTCAANNSQGLQRDSVLINIISKNNRKFHSTSLWLRYYKIDLSLMINNILIYFNIESRSGYPVPTDPDTEPGLDMGRRGNKFWNITEMWNKSIYRIFNVIVHILFFYHNRGQRITYSRGKPWHGGSFYERWFNQGARKKQFTWEN